MSMSSSWQRTLWIVWFAEFVSILGFSIILPILPFYVQEMGVTEPNAVKFWSGLIYSAHAVTMALISPVWGAISDRHGRKLMVERAMFGGVLVMVLMGLARTPLQLVLLRMLQGLLTGTVTAATTLVASIAPRERTGYALGVLQMGIYVGASLGPLTGGLIADTLGFQFAFWTTGGLLLIGGLLVTLLVKENFVPPPPTERRRGWTKSLGRLLSSRPILSAFSVRLVMRLGNQMLGPILPLFVQSLAAGGLVATLSGTVQGVSAAAGALGAMLLGRVGDRVGHRQVLLVGALASAILYIPQYFVRSVPLLTLLQGCTGLAMGGILAALSATLAALAPEGEQGAVYGLDASIVSLANGVAPLLGTSLAMAAGLPAPFLGAATLFACAGLVTARLLPKP